MRKPLMAGNWKMNKTRDEALQFIYAVNQSLPNVNDVETVIFAPSIILRDLVKRQGDDLRIGAQNCHYLDNGAYTGEIAPIMLKAIGVTYSLIGHSERRAYYNENDEDVNKKIKTCLSYDITPVVCVGESLEQREANETEEVLTAQIKNAFVGISALDVPQVVVAYEPIWAIGTGKTASADMADESCGHIRKLIAKLYNASVADEIRILYGGSVKPSNVAEFMSKENIDGGLVGGASLDANSFIDLCNACKK